MNFIDRYSDLVSADKDKFRRICRKLLANTFIVKEKDEQNRADYFFVRNPAHRELFNDYFEYIGYCVKVDETSGVVMLANIVYGNNAIQFNRIRLKLYESVIICALWLLYESKMTSDGLRAVTVTKVELNMEIERLGYANKIDKNSMQNALKKLSSFNLIDVIGEITYVECAIRLYPSLRFCMEANEFKTFVEQIVPKMRSGKHTTDIVEETDDEE